MRPCLVSSVTTLLVENQPTVCRIRTLHRVCVCVLHNFITNSMQQSPSLGDENLSASQEIPRFYGNRKFIIVLTRTHR
jgi:hypothetical protein